MKRVLGQWMTVCFLATTPGLALAAFDSGSTGADGVFSPTVNTVVQLPAAGVLNYTTVNIPAGVTVTFKKNATNTPVVILASGDVAIAGILDVRAGKSPDTGAAGDGNVGDDGLPGVGGPGGFDGGRGGLTPLLMGSSGVGPGAGNPGAIATATYACGGAGGGYSQAGAATWCNTTTYTPAPYGAGGTSYGSSMLLPLVGGSGGGGGAGGSTFVGSGGGGGGGAILIASSATVNVTGSILADGGASGASSGAGAGAVGGGGSGGAIRIVASTISGNGAISAQGGAVGTSLNSYTGGSAGATGRIRLEASTLTRTAATTPAFTTDLPGSVFVAGAPTLAITSVAGVAAPATPTGNADIVLPTTTVNPVTVTFTTTGVPAGNTIKLTVTPASGVATSAVSAALTGSTASASASVQVTLPQGPSVLQAQTTYTVVAALGDIMSRYAGNERVERVTLTASLGKPSTATLHTITGKEYQVPAITLASLGAGF